MGNTIHVVTAPGRCEAIFCRETAEVLEQLWKDEKLNTSRSEEVPFLCAEVIDLSFTPWSFSARIQISENDSLVCAGEIKYNGSEFELIDVQYSVVNELKSRSQKFLNELIYNKLFEQYMPEMHAEYLRKTEEQ